MAVCRLVRHIGGRGLTDAAYGASERMVDSKYAGGHSVAFSDGYPILLTSEVRPLLWQ
jgi:hypothetical protein